MVEWIPEAEVETVHDARDRARDANLNLLEMGGIGAETSATLTGLTAHTRGRHFDGDASPHFGIESIGLR